MSVHACQCTPPLISVHAGAFARAAPKPGGGVGAAAAAEAAAGAEEAEEVASSISCECIQLKGVLEGH